MGCCAGHEGTAKCDWADMKELRIALCTWTEPCLCPTCRSLQELGSNSKSDSGRACKSSESCWLYVFILNGRKFPVRSFSYIDML